MTIAKSEQALEVKEAEKTIMERAYVDCCLWFIFVMNSPSDTNGYLWSRMISELKTQSISPGAKSMATRENARFVNFFQEYPCSCGTITQCEEVEILQPRHPCGHPSPRKLMPKDLDLQNIVLRSYGPNNEFSHVYWTPRFTCRNRIPSPMSGSNFQVAI